MGLKKSFIVNRLKSIGFAFKGTVFLIKTEASIQIQFVIAVILTGLGFYFKISNFEWLFQVLAIGLVISFESINTAIERIADFIHPEHNKKIGIIKDMAAGAVFIAAFFACIVGLIIYIPKIFQL